jgi:hypothetical protein
MNSSVCFLSQTYIETESLFDEITSTETTNCLILLRRILEPFGMIFTQYNGNWYLIRIAELGLIAQDGSPVFVYDLATGGILPSTTITLNDIVIILTGNNIITGSRKDWLFAPTINKLASYRNIKVVTEFDYKNSVYFYLNPIFELNLQNKSYSDFPKNWRELTPNLVMTDHPGVFPVEGAGVPPAYNGTWRTFKNESGNYYFPSHPCNEWNSTQPCNGNSYKSNIFNYIESNNSLYPLKLTQYNKYRYLYFDESPGIYTEFEIPIVTAHLVSTYRIDLSYEFIFRNEGIPIYNTGTSNTPACNARFYFRIVLAFYKTIGKEIIYKVYRPDTNTWTLLPSGTHWAYRENTRYDSEPTDVFLLLQKDYSDWKEKTLDIVPEFTRVSDYYKVTLIVAITRPFGLMFNDGTTTIDSDSLALYIRKLYATFSYINNGEYQDAIPKEEDAELFQNANSYNNEEYVKALYYGDYKNTNDSNLYLAIKPYSLKNYFYYKKEVSPNVFSYLPTSLWNYNHSNISPKTLQQILLSELVRQYSNDTIIINGELQAYNFNPLNIIYEPILKKYFIPINYEHNLQTEILQIECMELKVGVPHITTLESDEELYSDYLVDGSGNPIVDENNELILIDVEST